MNLIIDIGNSLQKIAVFNNDEVVYCQSFPKITTKIIASVFKQFSIQNAILSSVAEADTQVVEFIDKHSKLICYSCKTKLPIKILYKTPETLGLDRIANAVGAAALFPNKNVLSIQAGTCLVFDFVNEKREYLGGSISPGLKMRFNALHAQTKNLPLLKLPEIEPDFIGMDTNSSIYCGVMHGIKHEINGFIEDYIADYKNITIIITGGNANYLQKLIKNTIFAAPNVVMKGLNEIIKYNE